MSAPSPIDREPTALNVVFLGNFPYPYGMAATRRIQTFVDGLVADGCSVEIILLRQTGAKASGIAECGNHRGVPFCTIGSDIEFGASLLFSAPAFLRDGIRCLRGAYRRDRCNLLYICDTLNPENVFFATWARRLGFHLVFDILEDYSVSDEIDLHLLARTKLILQRPLDRLHVRLAHGLITVSQFLLAKYDSTNYRNIPIRLIPAAARANRSSRWGHNRTPTVAYAGSFAPKDGVKTLVEAFTRLRASGVEARLLLIGSGPNAARYSEAFQGMDNLEFTGRLSDEAYDARLRDVDVLCVPRTASAFAARGFPFKLAEYLATGRPVVATDVGDIRLYLEHGRDAMIVPPDDPEALAHALAELMERPNEAKRIGDAGYTQWQKHFSAEVAYDKFKALIREILVHLGPRATF